MRNQTKQTEITIKGRTLSVNTWGGEKGCYVEMLHAIDDQISAMLSHHNKVLMVRLDVHVHDRTPDNNIMSDFVERLKRWASGYYKKNIRTGHVWCREVSSDKGLHYHLILLFNGDEVKSHYYVLQKAKQIARHHAHRGYRRVPHFGDDPMHMMITRGDDASYKRAFEWASYLAKTRTKDNKHRSGKGKNYSKSKIEHKVTDHHDKPKRKPKPTTDKPVHLMTDDERQLPLFD